MEDQTTATTEPSAINGGVASNIAQQPSETNTVQSDPQPTEQVSAPEKSDADPIQPIAQNVIEQAPDANVNTTDKIEQVDQPLDRDQEQKNSTEIVENSGKNDDTSSTTSDDSDDESSSSSMHLGLEKKKSKVADLDEDEDPADSKPIRSINELKELPPEEPVQEKVDDADQIALLGEVTHHVDEFIVIRSNSDTLTVDIDSVLCLEDRTVLGRVHETFGRVDNPLYSVRLTPLVTRVKEAPAPAPETPSVAIESVSHVPETTVDSVNGDHRPASDSGTVPPSEPQPQSTVTTEAEQGTRDTTLAPSVSETAPNTAADSTPSTAKETSFKKPASAATHVKRPPPAKGTKVYYVSKFSKVLSSWREVYSKGYDASNEHDEEVPEEELEFSDDEKEAEAKRLAKNKRKKPQQSSENSAAPNEDKKRPRKRAKHVANEGAAMTPVTQAPLYAPQPPGGYYPVPYPAPWPQPYVAGPYAPQFVAPLPGYAPPPLPYPTHINYYAPYPPNLHPPGANGPGRGRGNVNQSFVFTNPPNQPQQ